MKKTFFSLLICLLIILSFTSCDENINLTINKSAVVSESTTSATILTDSIQSTNTGENIEIVNPIDELIILSENSTHCTSFKLVTSDKSFTFSGHLLKNTNYKLYTEDVTNDNIEDYIIVFITDNNNDIYKEEIHIFDGADYKEYLIGNSEILTFLKENVSCEYYKEYNPDKKSDDSYYQLQFGESSAFIAYDKLESECLYEDVDYVNNYYFTLDNNKIKITIRCFSGWNEICGQLETEFTFSNNHLIPDSLTFIANDNLFEEITAHREKDLLVDDNFIYAYYKSGLKVIKYTGNEIDVTIPESFNNIPIVCVSEESFWGCNTVINLTMNSIYEIGDEAFLLCNNLRNVFAPNVISVGSNAFSSSLEKIEIDNARYIKSRAFDMSNLTEINLNNAEFIGDEAFYGTKLSEVSLPNVKHIGNQAFGSCTLLQKVYIPLVEIIDNDAFHGCDSVTLKSINTNIIVKDYYEENAWRGFLNYEVITGK